MEVRLAWMSLLTVGALVIGGLWIVLRILRATVLRCETSSPPRRPSREASPCGGISPLIWAVPALGIVGGLFLLRTAPSENPATVVESTPSEVRVRAVPISVDVSAPSEALEESSLFMESVTVVPVANAVRTRGHLAVGPLVVVGLLVVTIIVLASGWLRRNALALVPVSIATALVVALFVWTHQARDLQMRHERARQRQQQLDSQAAAWMAEVEARQERAPVPIIETPVGDETNDKAAAEVATDGANVSTTVPVVVFNGSSPEGEHRSELPYWVTQKNEPDGGTSERHVFVLSSGQYASVGEAEQELMMRLQSEVHERVQQQHPEVSGWSPKPGFILENNLVQQRAHEQTKLTIGEFTHPMYRVHWQVYLQPETDQLAYADWRAGAVNMRLLQLGGLFAVITLLLGSLATYFRIDQATGGKYRRPLMAGAVAACIAAGLAVAIVA